MSEVAFLLRKKIASKSAQTVGLTIQLIGVFVNNCGSRFHGILNDERFTRAIADAVRYFSKRPGHDSKDTTDVALDLIQSWGEAFLPRRRDYYHIVDLYFNLRKEGLPFKPQQFDPNRVPIFVDSNSGKALDNTDAILAASLASELALQEEQEERRRHRGGHHQDTHHSHSAGHSHDRPRSRQEEVDTLQLVASFFLILPSKSVRFALAVPRRAQPGVRWQSYVRWRLLLWLC